MNTNDTNTQETAMNAPAPVTSPLARAEAAAAKHAAAGTGQLGTMLVLTFDGIEVAVTEAVRIAQEVDLDADDLPTLRDRGAVRKALQSVGIYPSARHSGKGQSEAHQAVADDTCLRYSAVSAEKGDVLFSIQQERVDRSGPLPRVIQEGEAQRCCYFAEKRELVVYQDLLKPEIISAFDHFRGAYKSDSVRSFAAKILDKVKAVKLAGSTWFVPAGAEDTVAKLRAFFRAIPNGGVSFVGVTIMDEPTSREEVAYNASTAVVKEVEGLQRELFGHNERRDGGTRVRDRTVESILGRGRELREKLRTLRTLLGLEVSTVESKLAELDKGVRTFLDENAAAEAQRLRDAAAKAAAKGKG
jgi:hypothetical protein